MTKSTLYLEDSEDIKSWRERKNEGTHGYEEFVELLKKMEFHNVEFAKSARKDFNKMIPLDAGRILNAIYG